MTCSDQQVFTGAAYALTLRYWQGCKISAYHYNIVGNMMLISCATHLLSVTIVRHYWRYPALAFLRVLCITGVFTVTGLLMVNQNASDAEIRFPTDVPPANATSSLLFLSAACFETDKSPLHDTFKNTTSDAEAFFAKNIRDSAPGNTINGWNWYILLLLYYAAAIVAEGVRFVRRRKGQAGWGGTLARQVSRIIKPRSNLRKLMTYGNIAYLVGGILVSAIAVVNSINYIFKLRNWVARSGWIEEDNGVNPENDWSSFGQLVPIFMSGFILFSIAQIVSGRSCFFFVMLLGKIFQAIVYSGHLAVFADLKSHIYNKVSFLLGSYLNIERESKKKEKKRTKEKDAPGQLSPQPHS